MKKLKVEDQVKIFLTAIIIILMLSITGVYFYYEDYIKNNWSKTYILSSVFNTTVTYRFYAPNRKTKGLSEETRDLLIYYHMLFDRHNDYTLDDKSPLINLKTINDNYGTDKELLVDKDLADTLLTSLEHGEKTNGMFNIAIGELAKLWQTYFDLPTSYVCTDDSCQPSKEEIEELLVCTPSVDELKEILVINQIEDKYYVKFNKYNDCETVSLTLGGIAKGYALKQIGNKIDKKGYLTFLTATSSSYFNRYIEGLEDVTSKIVDPKLPQTNFAFSFKGLSNLASSTSGDYEQGFYVKENGKTLRRHHILNPNTGYSDNYFHSISAYLNDPLIADILTTSLFNLEFNESYKMYLEYKEIYPELEVAWINDESIIATDGIFDKIELIGSYNLKKASLVKEG